jgi:O-antigen ligase/tetratricopeptide (TPR) repeat protein
LLAAHLVLSPLVFSRSTLEVFEYNKVALLLLTALALAALGTAAALGRLGQAAADVRRLGRDPIALGVVLYVVSAVLSTALSISPRTSLYGAHESFTGLLTVVGYTVLFFATRDCCRSGADGRRLLSAVILASGLTASYAVVQATGTDPIPWQRVSFYGSFVRPFGTLGHANFLGAYLAMAVPVVAVGAWRAARDGQRLSAVVLGAVGILAVGAVVLTLSRGAWLALLAVGVVALALAGPGRMRRRIVTGAALSLGAIVLAGAVLAVVGGSGFRSGLLERVRHLTEATNRQYVWQTALDIFREHPFSGCGLDAFQLAFAEKRPAGFWLIEWNATPTKAHCEPLHVLATQGLPGAAALLLLTIGLVRAGWRALRHAGPELRPLVAATGAGLVGFFVQNLFGFTVAGCGTLFVTFAALLSRFAEPGGLPAAEERPERKGTGPLRQRSCPLSFRTLEDEPAWNRDPLLLALVGASFLGALVFVGNIFDGDHVGGPTALVAAIGVLSFSGLVTLAVVQAERGAVRASFPRGVVRLHPLVRLSQAAVWAGAAGLAFLGVIRPYLADRACARGVQLPDEEAGLALGHFEQAVRLDPDRDVLWVKLGSAAQTAARTAQDGGDQERYLARAQEAFRRAIALVPANPYNHANLGWSLGQLARRRQARPDEALAEYEAALALDRQNANFYRDACQVALQLGLFDRARAYAVRGLEIYPRYGPLHALLGCVALLEGRPEEAVRLHEEAFRLDWYGDVKSLTLAKGTMAASLLRVHRYAEALLYAQAALDGGLGSVETRLCRATALEGLGRREEAIVEYRAVLDLRPGLSAAQVALSRLAGRLPNP